MRRRGHLLRGALAASVAALVLVAAHPASTPQRFSLSFPRADAAVYRPQGEGLIAPGYEAPYSIEILGIHRGDTLMSLLVERGIPADEAQRAMRALARYASLRSLQIGQELTLVIERGAGVSHLVALDLTLEKDRHAIVERAGEAGFQARRDERPLDLTAYFARIQPAAGGHARAFRDDEILRKLVIGRGDTLLDQLLSAGSTPDDADRAIRALDDHVDLKRLQVGQEVTVRLVPAQGDEAPRLTAVGLSDEGRSYIVAATAADGSFGVTRTAAPLSLAVPGLAGNPLSAALALDGGLLDDLPSTEPRDLGAVAPGLVVEKQLTIARGDTLSGILQRAGATPADAQAASEAMDDLVSLRRLQVGQVVKAVLSPAEGAARLRSVELVVGERAALVERGDGDRFEGRFATASVTLPPLPPNVVRGGASTWTLLPRDHPLRDEGGNGLIEESYEIAQGDTLLKLLLLAGASDADAKRAIKALRPFANPRSLQLGQELRVVLEPGERPRLLAVSLSLEGGRFAVVDRADGAFAGRKADAPFDVAAYVGEPPAAPAAEEPAPAVAAALPDAPAAATGDPAVPLPPLPPRALDTAGLVEMPFVIGKGDTLSQALTGAGVAPADAQAAVEALKARFNPRRLQAGQAITLLFSADAFAVSGGSPGAAFAGLRLATEPGQELEVVRRANGGFAIRELVAELQGELLRADGVIDSSLYQAAEDSGLPIEVMRDMIAALSFDIDFQRDLRQGDRFDVIYERLTDDAGRFVRYGSPLFISMNLSGREVRIYLFAPEGGEADYFHADGQSVRKALLRSPINGARVTSSFGNRKDPFLGYTKKHKGIDFGAPKGTPILAAGSGVVEFVGRYSGYGNYVRIRHDGTYKTAYAHMSKFAKGLSKGDRVSQGEVIGYVGCSGRCTGPHLHYEVLVDNTQVDPNGVKLPTGRKLEGTELASFFATRLEIDRQFAELGGATQIAGQ